MDDGPVRQIFDPARNTGQGPRNQGQEERKEVKGQTLASNV
jgi:hypothetical protein